MYLCVCLNVCIMNECMYVCMFSVLFLFSTLNLPHDIISYHTIPNNTIPYQTIPYPIVSHTKLTIPYHAKQRHILSYPTLYHTITHHNHTIPYYIYHTLLYIPIYEYVRVCVCVCMSIRLVQIMLSQPSPRCQHH